MLKRFIYAVDSHWGYERTGGHKKPLHDIRAINAMLNFAADFAPHEFIMGGDALDCGAVSHHNKNKPGKTEGLKLLVDAQECVEHLIKPIESITKEKTTFIIANHEKWVQDLVDEMPSLEGILDIKNLLHLKNWNVIPHGGVYNLGKLTFAHGDTISGGENVAKAAVIGYERNIRFGHYHSYSVFTKNSPIEYKLAKTGIQVPCLCHKAPSYGKGKPNKWLQGFLMGYIGDGGQFNDYVITILDGKFIAPNGKLYKG